MYVVHSAVVGSVHSAGSADSADSAEFVFVVAFVLALAVEFGVALIVSSLNFLEHCVPEELTFDHCCHQKGCEKKFIELGVLAVFLYFL